ncbi:MAG: hypothetical protein Roseis2KO_44630 [Roseivirga sp.]
MKSFGLKQRSIALIALTLFALLSSGFSCGSIIKVVQEARITIEPDHILLSDKDTIQFETRLRVPRRLLKKNKELKLFYYLTSGPDRQLLYEINLAKAEKRLRDGLLERHAIVKQPILIPTKTGLYNIETKWTFIHKTGSYYESEQLGIGLVFTDSTEYLKFRKEQAEGKDL